MTLTAGDLMTGNVRVVHAAWSVRRLLDFLGEHSISGAPVIDDGQLVGVVSLTDIARSAKPHRHGAHAHEVYLLGPAYAYAHTPREPIDHTLAVRDIMTPAVFDVPLAATAKEIAELMLHRHIHRIFVTESGMVIGVITAFDMLKALV